jgi:cytochrome c-type biogenesis protein CcmH
MARERGGGGKSTIGRGDVAPGTAVPQDDAHRAVAKPGAEKDSAKPGASVAAASISGRVELSAAVKGKAGPVDGPRMPLAALRARAADLPLDFVLDDSQAVMPGSNLSSAQQVRIEVRVSKSGQAAAGKGDLTGKSSAVKPGAKGVRVVIDQIEP